MSELYRHLLVPPTAAFVPDHDAVARFYDQSGALGALPIDPSFTVITFTGKTRAYGRNPNTGEVFYGPELTVNRFAELKPALESIRGEQAFDLSVEGKGPAAIPPFDLYSADNYASPLPGTPAQGPYEFTVRCKQRDKATHLLHSAFGCECELKPDEPGLFENPWNHQPIHAPTLGCARFWIEFGIGDYLMPMVADTLDILDQRLVDTANDVFHIKFNQGCIRNDD